MLLERWQRRNVALFVAVMTYLLLFLLSAGLGWISGAVELAGYALLLVAAAISIPHHGSARCPACGRHLCFQSSLLVPSRCEICGAALRAAD